MRSIAASEVEGLVLGQVRRLLASPELVARTITAVRRENSSAEDTELEEGDVIEALGALQPVWDELYPAEQARILRLLIERIDVAPDGTPSRCMLPAFAASSRSWLLLLSLPRAR